MPSFKWWGGEYLGSTFSMDTETTIVPSYQVPEMVIGSAYNGTDAFLIDPKQIKKFLKLHRASKMIFHNAAFDIRVLEAASGMNLTDLYERGQIWDTSILYRLLHLAVVGWVPYKYNLALLTKKYCGIELDKEGSPRMDYARFLNNLKDLPPEHQEYTAKDAIYTYKVFYHMMVEIQKLPTKTFLSHQIQVIGDYALKRVHENGIKVDLEAKDAWLEPRIQRLKDLQDRLGAWGWVRGQKGLQARYEAIIARLEINLPKTEDGSISSKAEDLLPFKKQPFIKDYLEYIELEKATTFVRDIHTSQVHPRYNVLVNTGRTSCSKPNFQQLPRSGNIREIFVASEENTFLITDYSAIELATLAQVCLDRFGHSTMADRINEGEDLHKYYASVLYDIPTSEVTKEQRQSAKVANFGFPGGLGSATFIKFAAGYDIELNVDQAEDMRRAWFQAFPEMVEYMEGSNGAVITKSGRVRGETSYCAEKNTPFQGLAADGAKLALWYLNKAGFKIVGFVHDEIITEVPKAKAKDLVLLQEKIMVDSMQKVVPDVKISVESTISNCYTK